jgi:hypothetical protein
MASKLALRAYLMTAGRDKVGFSVVKREANGQPQYVSGSRATVERNTMRYYLAIDAYLSGLEAPAENGWRSGSRPGTVQPNNIRASCMKSAARTIYR